MKGNALQYKVLPLVLQSVTVYHTKYYLSKTNIVLTFVTV